MSWLEYNVAGDPYRAVAISIDMWTSMSDIQLGITAQARFWSKSNSGYTASLAQGYTYQGYENQWNPTVTAPVNNGGWNVPFSVFVEDWRDYYFNRTNAAQYIRINVYGAMGSGWSGDICYGDWVYISPLPTPTAPSNCVCTRNSDTANTVTWSNNGANPRTNNLIERSVNGGGWTQVGSVAGSVTTWVDGTTAANNYYQYRVRARYTANGYNMDSGYATSSTTYNTPSVPTVCTNTRNSDLQNTVSWTNGASASVSKTTYLERQINGGAWSQIATVSGTTTSYVDNAASVNNSYAYRVRSGWGGTYSAYATSGMTYNTPSAPGKPQAARNVDNSIAITFANSANTSTAIELQRSTDASTWATVKTQTGNNLTSITDNPGGGTFYYRVRNTRDALVSAWSEVSDKIVTIAPPAAPSLTSPLNSAVIPTSTPEIILSWMHNPVDGSVQTAAEVQYSTNEGTSWTTVNVTTAQSYQLANNFSVNTTVTWRVRTKGADPSFGPYSSNRAFVISQTPSVSLTSPPQIIESLPIVVSWNYTDLSGTQQQAQISLLSDTGSVLFSRTIQGTATSTSIFSSDYLPANGSSYTLRVSVRSTSSLTNEINIPVSTDYLEPPLAEASVDVDWQKASVSLAIHEVVDAALPGTVAMGIFRRRKDGSTLMFADQVPSGAAVTDKYPPLDETLVYLFVAYAETGVASIREVEVVIPSRMQAYINFGDNLADVARLMLDTKFDASLTHQKEIIETAGLSKRDAYPLVIYGESQSYSGNISGTAMRDDSLIHLDMTYGLIPEIEAARDWTGYVVLRLPYEEPFAADITISKGTDMQYASSIAIQWERVRANGLAI